MDINLRASRNKLVPEVLRIVDAYKARAGQVALYRFGFYRLSFAPNRLTDGFALHVWFPTDLAEELPHTHIFDLESRVLLGGLEDRTWTVTEDPQGTHSIVLPKCTEKECSDEPVGTNVNIKLVGTRHVTQDEYYCVPKGSFHTSQVLEFPTVTVIRRLNVDANGQSQNIVPLTEQLAPLRSFDIFDHDQNRAWAIIDTALAQL